MSGIIFLLIWLVLMGFILYGVFTKKGRNKAVSFMFGEVVEDLGPLEEIHVKMGVTQKTRLLHCRQDGADFLVLETTDSMPGSIQTHWTKIDDEMLRMINSMATPSQ